MRQTVFTIIAVAALAGIAFFLYRSFGASPAEGEPQKSVTAISAEQLAEYEKLEALRVDLGIFEDPAFRSLVSPLERLGARTEITVKPGRQNPFTPF